MNIVGDRTAEHGLSKMGRQELDLLKKSAKARKLIKELKDVVETVAAVAGIGIGSKNGKA